MTRKWKHCYKKNFKEFLTTGWRTAHTSNWTEEKRKGRKERSKIILINLLLIEGRVEDYNIVVGKTMHLRRGND